MKLKYKKIILLTTMSTMGIGLLTLSITKDQPEAKESLNPESKVEASAFMSSEDAEVAASSGVKDVTENEAPTTSPAPTSTPAPSPTPTPIPVSGIEEIKEIDDLITEYYNAKVSRDTSRLKSIYSNPSKVETMEELEKLVKYIEECKNVKTYAKKSYEEGAYIVYAVYDIKFVRINTLAPSLSKLYVVTDATGKYKIYSDEMNPELQAYYDERNNDEDVLELIRSIDEKSTEAKASDEDLMIFWTGLDKLAKEQQTKEASTEE